MCVDMHNPGFAELMLRLIPTFDVVVENFRPGVMKSIGIDYESCRAVNPRLVYVSISGWGQHGPESERPAFAIVIHAEAGITLQHLHLYRPEHPVSDVFSHADVYSGLQAVSGALAALYQRERTGVGQHVDVSMMSTALFVNEHANAQLDPDWPLDHVNRAPILRVGDQFVALVADPVEPVSFGRLAIAMVGAGLDTDPRFVDQTSRVEHRQELMDLIERWVSTFDSIADLEIALAAVRIPVGIVRTVRDVAASPWAAHRGAIAVVSDRQGGTIPIPNSPWQFSAATAAAAGGPSWRGEHNAAVLSEAGISVEEIEGFQTGGILVADSQIRHAPASGR
jgi:crotonobetainyl-CoA:carnitine CoA-transferase CaiB-like acyl-CoA transferase